MGVITCTLADITSPIAPGRLFQALAIDNHNFMPKATPDYVKSVEFVEGDSTTVGCIKKMNFPDGAPFKYVKNRVDEIDEANNFLKYTTIEGDMFPDTVECAVYDNKFEASADGSRCTMVAHYHMKGDNVLSEADLENAKQGIHKMFKSAEEYLIANPQLYA